MNRRALLAAAAPAALLAGCGEATTQPQEVPTRGTSDTAKQGDRELLDFLADADARLEDRPDERMAAYMDALPKLSDPATRGEVFDRFVDVAVQQAKDRDEPIGDAFVTGEAPA